MIGYIHNEGEYMTNTINQTDLDKIKTLLKGDLYIKPNGNMHGGSIILSKKGRNKNAKIAQISVNEDLKPDQNVIDFIIENIVEIDFQDDRYFVRIKDTDSLVIMFTTVSDYEEESSEFFLLA